MPDMTQVQEAMRVWDEAHAQMQGYLKENDVLVPKNWERWNQLMEAENLARTQAITAVNAYHDARSGPAG